MAKRFAFYVLSQIPSGIWVLGFVSLLMDVSSEMIHSVLPLFLVTVLGTSVATIGLIEGFSESMALFFKVFSGFLSDYLRKRKEIVLLGYGLSALTKPLFMLASGVGLIFTARLIDRIGKGIRGSPRDALIADISPSNIRGASFGLRQSLDTLGAVLGPLLAFLLMFLFKDNFRVVFFLALIPAFFAVFLIGVGVRDPVSDHATKYSNPLLLENLKQFSSAFWWICLIGGMIALARFSEAFLVLRALDGGMSLEQVPLVLMWMNLLYATTAYPFGVLADSISPRHLLGISLIVLIGSDWVLATSHDRIYILVGVGLWGCHMGLSQGLLAAMVASAAPLTLRGSAFGFYNVLNGIAVMLSSALAGFFWQFVGAPTTFYMGALFCLIALCALGLGKKQIS